MSTNSKYFSLVMGAVAGLFYCIQGFAIPSSSDELYSESIYLQKSSAEVPSSLESSARSSVSQDLEESQIDSPLAMETIEDLDEGQVSKKVSARRAAKKSVNN